MIMEEKHIKKVLDFFPSNVKVYEIVTKQSKTFVQHTIEKRLREEDADTFDNDIEKLKGYNLLSFLYFVLNDKDEASKYNDLALEVNDRNINALACRTFYHLQWLEFHESSQKCKKLKSLRGHHLEILSAKAEVAYMFSKFGMKFYPEARKRFEEVLIESEGFEVPTLYICSWNFSLAQTIRRQLNMHNAPMPLEPSEQHSLFNRVVTMFTSITYKEGQGIDRYRAKAFAELGLVLYFNRNADFRLDSVYGHEECMRNALVLQPDDALVLERCGKHFRLNNKISEAIRCFKLAIDKKPTSYSHHHLGICYKIQIINEQTANKHFDRNNGWNRKTPRTTYERNAPSEDNLNWRRQSASASSAELRTSFRVRGGRGSARQDQQAQRGNAHFQDRHMGYVPVGNANVTHSVRGSWAGHSWKRSGPMSPQEKFQSKILKCPKMLQYISPSDIGPALRHFDQAITISHDNNTAALYDKGLIFRASKQLDAAIENFKLVLTNETTSDIQLANSYEQAAMCLLEKADDEPAHKDAYEFDAKVYLKKAIEIACSMVKKVPNLRRCWNSTPTLKMLLLRQARTKQTLWELSYFYKLVDNYPAAIEFLEIVLQMEEDEDEKHEVLVEMIKANLNLKKYDEALLALRMILCLPNGDETIEKELLLDICIKGGMDAWKRGDREVAKKRFKTALRPDTDERLETENDNVFDMFMLCSQTSEDKARQLCNNLKSFGLNITLNSDDILPGHPERGEIMDRVEASPYVVIFIGVEDEMTDLDYLKTYTDMIQRFMLISEGGRAERDSLYSRYDRMIKLDCELREDNGNLADGFLQWVEEFFFAITSE